MALDVNDIRHFAAVARAGSTLAAAQALRVNQTTCARRIAALERALGLTLFERASTGYRLTPGGAQLLAHAERLEHAAAELEQAAANLTRAQRAEIRFSTSDVLADLVAGPAIASFARLHPDIRVALRVDSRAVDLTGREADIALRAAPEMTEKALVARKIMETPWAFYCVSTYAAEAGMPKTLDDISRHPIAALEGRPTDMLRAAFPQVNIRAISNSMNALVEVIKSGGCIGAVPMLVGEQHRELVRCFVLDIDAGGLWIMFHERLRREPHIRAFVDHLTAHIKTWRDGLINEQGGSRVSA
jgi:DNA-binding transcriptional LysR family regulator